MSSSGQNDTYVPTIQAAQPLDGMRFRSSPAIRSADGLKLAF